MDTSIDVRDASAAWRLCGPDDLAWPGQLLLVSLRQNAPRLRVDHVVRSAPLGLGILQIVIDVPAVVFQDKSNAIGSEVAVCLERIGLGDGKSLVARDLFAGYAYRHLCPPKGIKAGSRDHLPFRRVGA